jgi:hypothetical protein
MSSARPRGVAATGDDEQAEILAREFGNRQ